MKWRSLEESTPGADTRSLHEQFAERKELIDRHVPPETRAVHARVVAELKASSIEERALTAGALAPAFELKAHNDKIVRSEDLLANGRLVICFFRGRWCPSCVGQLEAMDRVLPQIQEAGATLVAVSPQTVHQSYLMADQHKFRFPSLSDPGNQAARAFGLVYRVPEDQQAIYRRAFINLPFVNGDDSWELPIPATYIVERDGRVLWASASADFTERPEPEEVLHKLAQ